MATMKMPMAVGTGGSVLNPQIVWSPSAGNSSPTAVTNIPVTIGKTYCFMYFRSTGASNDNASVTGGDIISSLRSDGNYGGYYTRGTIFKATANTVSFSWSVADYTIGSPMLIQLD